MIIQTLFAKLILSIKSISSSSQFILILAAGFMLIYRIFIKESRAHKLMAQIICPPKHFIFGNALDLNLPSEELFPLLRRWSKLYGKRFAVWLGFATSNSCIVLANAKDVEKVLSSQLHIAKSKHYDFLLPWLGTGLLTSRGNKWFRRRKLLTQAFHFRILEDFVDIFNEQSNVLIQILHSEFSDGKVFNLFPFVTRCALDVICETAMGKRINAQQVRDSDYVRAVYRISELVQYRQIRPWFHPSFIWYCTSKGREEKTCLNILHGFTERVIQERKLEFLDKTKLPDVDENGNLVGQEEFFGKVKRRAAFMDLLLEAQATNANLLTDLDIREETDTFMFEGHDTTAANVNWTIFLLACHPEYQAKVHEELDLIFGQDITRPITSDDISQMKYLDYCVKESLRLYPSVPFIARAIDVDLVLDDKTIIPAGITAMVMPYQLHRDPDVFPDPETFIPDRFYPENVLKRQPFAYIPFSAGPRNCIGQKFAMMEEKIVLANFFRNFIATSAEKREDIILLPELIIRPQNGLHISIKPRF